MLVMKIVLATVSLQILKLSVGHKSKLFSDFGHRVKILKLKFRQNLKLEFGRYFVADVL